MEGGKRDGMRKETVIVGITKCPRSVQTENVTDKTISIRGFDGHYCIWPRPVDVH